VRKLAQGLLIAALFSTAPAFADAIKIGVAGPLTGPYAAFGDQLYRGALQAVEDINKAGGINGKQLVLVQGDDACEPKQAVTVAHHFADEDKVNAVVGHFCSSSTIPASAIYNDADILMITPASTNPAVTDKGLKTIFRTCGRDDQQGPIAAEFIIDKLKNKQVAVVHDKDTYGKGLADAMKTKLEKLGGKVVLYEGLTRGEKDFNALVTKIKDAKADAIYFGGLHTEAGPLVRQLRGQGVEIPFVSGDGIVSEDFVKEAGGPKMVKNVYMTFGVDPRNVPEGKKIVDTLVKHGFNPEGYTLYSYATVQAIAEAMKQTKSTEGKKLADWLHNHSVNTVLGEKSWDNKGDLKTSDYVIYEWDDKGKYKQIKK
jgi:branched-chain amino acid transport system substrate-binding protein